MQVEPEEAQRVIVCGYKYNRVRYLFLTIEDRDKACRFLGKIASEVTRWTEEPVHQAKVAINVALTASGVNALQLPGGVLRTLQELAPEFMEGAHRRAALHLGDTGPSAVGTWDSDFSPASAHCIIAVFADAVHLLKTRVTELREQDSGGFVGWDTNLKGKHLTRAKTKPRKEHFGFSDGISQPVIRDLGTLPNRSVPESLQVPAGEFLLGYPNIAGENQWSPRALDPDLARFFRNGSFGVLRKMYQDVAKFKSISSGQYPEYVQAKMCGRWPNGAVVSPENPHQSEDGKPCNNFDFHDDPAGAGCPIGSHIRRLNSRDASAPLVPLMRRGIPYGRPYEDTSEGQDREDRGLLGLFICSDLRRQFEFTMRNWVDAKIGGAKDPLVGNHEPGGAFHIPQGGRPELNLRLDEPLVRTRGTLYVFFPSFTALQRIAAGA